MAALAPNARPMKFFHRCLLGAMLFLAAPAQAVPVVVNGGFETGDLTGWTASDPTNVSVVPSVAGDGFIGQHVVLNLNNPATATDVVSLDSFLGLDPGCLEGDGITYGVAIKQDIFVLSGDSVPFDFHFLSNIALAASNPNQVYVTISQSGTGVNDYLVFLPYADGQTLTPARDGYNFSYNPSGQTEAGTGFFFATTGIYTLGFLIADDGLPMPSNSALALDNIGGPPGAPELDGSASRLALFWLAALLLLLAERLRPSQLASLRSYSR